MKIRTIVTFEKEVDVYLDIDDIAVAIADDSDSYRGVLSTFNNIGTFLRALPDDYIEKITKEQRKVIIDFFEGAIVRLKA